MVKASETEDQPPMPLPNQRTIDNMPLPPPCKSADFEEAQKIRKRTLRYLKAIPNAGVARWVAECLVMDLSED